MKERSWGVKAKKCSDRGRKQIFSLKKRRAVSQNRCKLGYFEQDGSLVRWER